MKRLKVGYSEGTANTLREVLKQADLANSEIIAVEQTFAEKLARFITNPDCRTDFIINCKFWVSAGAIFTRIWYSGDDGLVFIRVVFLWSYSSRLCWL